MKKVLEELWHGNLYPQEMCRQNDPQVEKLHDLLIRNRAELLATMDDKQKEIMQRYDDNSEELTGILECEIFTLGFKLGVRITTESLFTSKQSENV